MDQLITLAIEVLFGLVFLGALVTWVRHRDTLSRDVTLVFSGLTLLFALDLVGRVFGPVPTWMTLGAALLLLAQPVLTLRLVANAGLVRGRIVLLALAAYLVTAVPLLLLPPPLPAPLTLATVAVFFVTEGAAATYLAREALRRGGGARVRLAVGATATALFGIALLFAGFGGATGAVAEVASIGSKVTAVLSALGYILAFLPPPWQRRVLNATAAFDFTEQLLRRASEGAPARELWERLADTAWRLTGARAAVVVLDDAGRARVAAFATDRVSGDLTFDALVAGLDLHRAVDHATAAALPAARSVVDAVDGRLVSVLPFDAGGGVAGALVLVFAYPSLFHDDDRRLLAILTVRTALTAERAAVVAEQAALSERLAATVEALRGASQAKSDFLASMSHELRTPLSAIIGFSELMRSEPAPAPGQVTVPLEWVEHINTSGEHLLGLINDVLDLTKVEAGRIDLQKEELDVRAAVSEAIEGVRPLADRRRQTLSQNASPAWVLADRGRLRQVLYNLLSNAIKFTPEEGSISVEVAAEGAEVRISVVDTGVGIAPDDQARVFDEFSQVGDVAAREGGTGLGLALTRRLVEVHGGQIELESTLGQGSRFTVVLPGVAAPSASAARSSPTAAASSPVAALPPGAAVRRDSAEVLVIEDDPSAIRLLRTYLEADGYTVRVASDGERGLAEARGRAPAAIILDVLLPGVDGWEVLRRLKADPELRDVPVIVVTVVDERELGLALGAVDYYLKPVDRTALLARLSRYTFSTKARQGTVRVLAIDDDPAALELVRAALEPEGFELVGHTDPVAALAAAGEGAFDLVICDLVMPGMDGFEVIAQLQQDARTREVPILVLTARILSEEDKSRLNGNIIGIVEKGAGARERLLEWLRRAVRPVAA
jgi:signal transduction histidine kinase/CheY-like chemotaxis protein